ncbi:hypothetical protein A0J61_05129 [Choanephora cucurbitarum]|uniref:Uncharacterized protein n=1 Tax=Choanephora cucurbitarum TaxID=101091 RepID=A0A1C7NDI3_9FUNG|nr:hypothetical protein A0J61_05129 [Choanephora cucurbitarum]
MVSPINAYQPREEDQLEVEKHLKNQAYLYVLRQQRHHECIFKSVYPLKPASSLCKPFDQFCKLNSRSGIETETGKCTIWKWRNLYISMKSKRENFPT